MPCRRNRCKTLTSRGFSLSRYFQAALEGNIVDEALACTRSGCCCTCTRKLSVANVMCLRMRVGDGLFNYKQIICHCATTKADMLLVVSPVAASMTEDASV
ncbi:Hypothetical protein SMAX5B_020707 [Scophthalmus maximus]|uniref:Uncharacterized protein n=1 Tax=Scophthalmus maximus TaxID=52904 RepID=A0A2U9CRD6_SCOMX|nr:Hypothetical protein SMAX5B_020707 [Scophthalmus maximus]